MARKKTPTNMSLTPLVRKMLDELVVHLGFANKSELVAQLARERYAEERGKGLGTVLGRGASDLGTASTSLNDATAVTPAVEPPAAPAAPTRYTKPARKK